MRFPVARLKDGSLLNSRKDVFVPLRLGYFLSGLNPCTWLSLKTASYLSIIAPNLSWAREGALPTMAHDLNRLPRSFWSRISNLSSPLARVIMSRSLLVSLSTPVSRLPKEFEQDLRFMATHFGVSCLRNQIPSNFEIVLSIKSNSRFVNPSHFFPALRHRTSSSSPSSVGPVTLMLFSLSQNLSSGWTTCTRPLRAWARSLPRRCRGGAPNTPPRDSSRVRLRRLAARAASSAWRALNEDEAASSAPATAPFRFGFHMCLLPLHSLWSFIVARFFLFLVLLSTNIVDSAAL